MTEFTPQQIMDRGQEAKRILESEVFKSACHAADEKIITAWKRGETPAAREDAFYRFAGLKDFITELKITMGRGEVAANDAEKQKRADTATPGG